MKKVGRIILTILLLIILLIAGLAFYAYKTVNNYEEYSDKFVDYETELAKYEGKEFKEFISYDKDNYVFEYAVPSVYLYKIINKESMSKFLSLPEDFTIEEVGIEPNIDNKTVKIYLGIKYKNLIHTALIIDTYYQLSEDNTKVELKYKDYQIINDKVKEQVDKYVNIKEGLLMFTHEFPTFVIYYQMPTYKPEYIYDLSYDKEYIRAKYDIKGAIEKYKEEEYDKNTLAEKLDAVWLEVRQSGITIK